MPKQTTIATPETAALLRKAARLLSRIAELQSKRALLIEGLPFGTYSFEMNGEMLKAGISLQTSSHLSIKALRQYVDPVIIRRCTVRGATRKTVKLSIAALRKQEAA